MTTFPLENRPGVPLDEEYLRWTRERPLIPVTLPGGHRALLVTRYADVRTVLADDRFSREAWGNGTLFARRSSALALVTSDAPTHPRRRRAVQSWFTGRRAEADRPKMEALAERLLDEMEKDGPATDLIARFALPFPYAVICDMLGVPMSDLDTMLPWVSTMMSAGGHPADEVAAAHRDMYAYFAGQLADRRRAADAGTPGEDLLTDLLTAPQNRRLSDEEITIFGFGLLMAGGETASNFLASCLLELFLRPELMASLRADPTAIPAAVEEFLRWTWFAGTGGQPHVVLEDVEVAGTVLHRGQVVVPWTDSGNRDRAVFPDGDEFRADRSPNPHLGFGHGRHMCLGASHARLEIEVALAAILRRFDCLRLAADPAGLRWRDQMFIRGVWELPVTWSTGTEAGK